MSTPWRDQVIYQIYPRSFRDSTGDGIGDIGGIIEKVDYLVELGIQAVWLSPVYPSPMADFGYDVTDMKGVDPLFGSLDDLKQLITLLHSHNIKLIMDFIPNHTSCEHPWFVDSKSSRDSTHRDWYIWRDPAPSGGPPNNWLSIFGGPAWTLDQTTGQYYYHTFLREQPDLNWRNPQVYDEMVNTMKYWLDMGVDGFRVDAYSFIYKDTRFLDEPREYNPPKDDPYYSLRHIYSTAQPELFELTSRIQHSLSSYEQALLVSETNKLTFEEIVRLYHSASPLHLPFNFFFISLPWNARVYRKFITQYESAIRPPYVKNYVIGNHDKPRIATRVGPEAARVAAMLQLTLPGMPTIYYGEELGMTNVPIPPEYVHDRFEKNLPGMGFGRDPQRSPMRWDNSPGAGFTTGAPWLPLGDYHGHTVADQRSDPASFLALYKALLALRKSSPALSDSTYQDLELHNDFLLAYIRGSGNQSLTVILNYSPYEHTLTHLRGRYKVILSTYMDAINTEIDAGHTLRGHEGVILSPC